MVKTKLPPFVSEILEKVTGAGYQIYIVGGAVRDLLMEKEPKDWDFATGAKPEEVLAIFPDAFYDNVFGTVKLINKENLYEITTYRREWKYSDRRHPDILEWGKSIEEDLSRRDFTVNAMALKISNLVDPFGGEEDLKNKLLRAVGNPNERFSEDALRLVRAIRFSTQLEFLIEPKTLSAISQNAKLIESISGERIRDELLKILASRHPADGFRLLRGTGLLAYILPELDQAFGIAQSRHHKFDVGEHSLRSLAHCPSRNPLIRLATLLHDLGKVTVKAYQCKKCGKIFRAKEEPKVTCPACQTENRQQESAIFYNHEMAGASITRHIADRLHFSKKDRDRIVNLVRQHQFTVDEKITDSAIRRFIQRVGEENIDDILDLRIGDRLGGGCIEAESWRLKLFKKRIWEIQHPPPSVNDLAIDGNDVMKILGIGPGPEVGRILKKLFEETIDEPEKNNKEYLLKKAKELKEKL